MNGISTHGTNSVACTEKCSVNLRNFLTVRVMMSFCVMVGDYAYVFIPLSVVIAPYPPYTMQLKGVAAKQVRTVMTVYF